MIVIGVDIGGGSIKGGTVRDNGELLDKFSFKIDPNKSQEEIILELADNINSFVKSHHYDEPISGIGCGIPGIIDSKKGVVCSSANLRWVDLPIKELLEKQTGLETRITNDANAAALGEALYGIGKKYQSSVMLTLGTGVGGGVVVDGHLLEGNEGKGYELGHMVIVIDGRLCGCGRKGCFEQYASATALVRETKHMMGAHPDSLMHKLAKEYGEVNGMVAFEAAKKHDIYAESVVNNYIKYLSEGILNYCNIFRPEAVILSGGIANQKEYLTDRIKTYLEINNFGYYGNGIPKSEILIASLGYDAGKIGAAALFYQKDFIK